MKKLLTALVVALLLWALPSVALAETSGMCGSNLTWTLTDDGVLTISGTGVMNKWSSTNGPGWEDYAAEISNIVIGDEVTSIGSYAFSGCTSLTNVQIPDSVTSIGSGAFNGCTSLTNVQIPDSVTSIGGSAFTGCTSLTSFAFPSGMTKIESFTFKDSAIEKVVIPENITYIGYGAFSGCETLSSATLHNKIAEIDKLAFSSCSSLESIFIPDNITVKSSNAFSSTIVYANIGSQAAYSYTKGTTAEFRDPDCPELILENNSSSTGDHTYKAVGVANPDITEIVVPEGVTLLYETFMDCTKLTSVTLPESLTAVGSKAFQGCTSLESIVIPDGVTVIGGRAFDDCTGLKSIEMNGVTEIESYAFENCDALTGIIVMPESLTQLHKAFEGCDNLSGILLPDHMSNAVSSYGVDFYANRESETALVCTQVNYDFKFIDPDYPEVFLNTYQTEDGELYYEVVDAKPSITTIDAATFPEGTTLLANAVFLDCKKLTSVTIPESITVIPVDAFSRCSQLKSVTLHDGITQLSGYAFAFTGIESIYLPGSIGEVRTWLFQGCESLKNVTLGDGITAIADYAFGGVQTLQQIYIPSSVISIGEQSGSDVIVDPETGNNKTEYFTFTGYNTDVYCYEFSYAEHWGNSKCRQAILLDGKDTDEILTVSIPEELLASTDLPVTIPASVFPVTNNQVVTWTSSRPTVATIDNEGVLTPLNAGVTTITLTVNGVSASCTVTVRASLKSMLLPETVYAVAKGSVQLPLQLVPADAAVELTYTMAADNFGSISNTGWITAPSYITTPSTTTMTVRDQMSGKEATTQLCITYPVTAISFAQPTVQVMGGESALLTANVTMRSDSCVNQLVTFTSSDTGIATVDAFGCVKGFKPGSATITATADSGVTATCEVIVGASGLSGDLSGDEAVTVDDVLALMDSLADPDSYSDVADVDKDADVDQDDMLLLMQYLSGWGVKLQ